MVAAGSGGAGGAGGGGDGGVGGGAPPPRPVEANYLNDINWTKALNFQNFKEIMKSNNVFQIHTGRSFMKDFKNSRVGDLISEFHMQYLYIMETKVIPGGVLVENFNAGLFNANDMHHPFNQLKRWIILPVLARYGGIFPSGVMVEGVNAVQAAQNWIASIVYDN